MRKGKKFIINMFIMGMVSLLMRSVSMSFQIYLTGRIGAEGVGVFQLIMSVYSFAVTVALSGIRLAATRMVTEEIAQKRYGGVIKSVNLCVFHALFFGLISSYGLFNLAPFLGQSVLNDERTIKALKILALDLPITALAAVFNGYFTAVRKTYKSAVVQVLDEGITILFTLISLPLLVSRGLEYAAIAIVGSSSLAQVFSFFILYILYLIDRKPYKAKSGYSGGLFGKMVGISIPVAFSAYARTGLNSLQHLLIPIGLKKSGASATSAMVAYGTIHGMAFPLLLFLNMLLSTLSDLIIPEFSECKTRGNNRQINFMVSILLKTVCTFSIAYAGVLMFFSGPLAQTIYSNNDVIFFLRIFGPLVPIMYCDTAIDGMLKGLGEQVNVMRYSIADAALGIIAALTVIPALGIDGYIITIFVTEIFNFYLGCRKLVSITNFEFSFVKNILLPAAFIFVSLYISSAFIGTVFAGLNTVLFMLLSVILGAVLYILFLYVFRCISRADLVWFRGLFAAKN